MPGGCNMEFMVETAPYQKLKYSDDIIQIDAQMASLEGVSCDNYVLSYSMYHLYLPTNSFNDDVYFSYIIKMATPKNIEYYGTKVNKYLNFLF